MDVNRERMIKEKSYGLLWGYPTLINLFFTYFRSLDIIGLGDIVVSIDTRTQEGANKVAPSNQGFLGYLENMAVGLKLPRPEASLFKHKHIIPVSHSILTIKKFLTFTFPITPQGCAKGWTHSS